MLEDCSRIARPIVVCRKANHSTSIGTHQFESKQLFEPCFTLTTAPTFTQSTLRSVQRQYNAAQVERKLALLGALQHAEPTLDAQLAAGDQCGALDLIATARHALDTELRGVAALRPLAIRLRDYEQRIAKSAVDDFVQQAGLPDTDLEPMLLALEKSRRTDVAVQVCHYYYCCYSI